MMDDKNDALYVKACVIPANEEDIQGDSLSSEDIKRIFTSFNNQNNFEIYHHGEKVDGITLLENYINKAEEQVGDRIAPIGSWLITMKLTNPTIKDMVNSHMFEGVSLSSTVNKNCCGLNLPEITTYADVGDMECVTPQFISLVGKRGTAEGPANGYSLEVLDYATYIKKSINGGKTLDFKEMLDALKDLVSRAESVEVVDEAPVILKNNNLEKPVEETIEEDVVEEETIEEAEKAEEDVVEEDVVEEVDEPIQNNDAKIAALEEKIENLIKIIQSSQDNDTQEVLNPKIKKNSKRTIITETVEPIQNKASFNERTGRDSFGRKIRK